MSTILSNGRRVTIASKSFPLPTSTPSTSGPTPGWVALLRGDGAGTSYDGIYKSQPMVFATVNKLVYGISRLPIKCYEYGLDGDSRTRLRSHPLARLMNRPMPRRGAFHLKAAIAYDLHVHGQALVVKGRESVGAAPNELWPVPWRNVQVISDERGPIAYGIQIGGEVVAIGAEDVVHFQLPADISPLEPLRRTLALEDAAMTFQGESLHNGVNGGRLQVTSAQRINDQTMARLRIEFEKMYAGSENSGRALILDQGLEAKPLNVTAADVAIMEQRKLSREEVCAAYDVPPPLVGILDRATYNNTSELRRALYDTIATKLVLIEETFQAQLVDAEPAWDGLFLEFDTNELLRPDPETRAKMHMLTQQASVTTVNERRQAENLPRIDDPSADTVLMPVNMVGVGENVSDTPTDNPSDNLPDAGTPQQGIADPAFLVNALTEALKSLPQPVINLVTNEDKPKSRRLVRDAEGNISKIVEE